MNIANELAKRQAEADKNAMMSVEAEREAADLYLGLRNAIADNNKAEYARLCAPENLSKVLDLLRHLDYALDFSGQGSVL